MKNFLPKYRFELLAIFLAILLTIIVTHPVVLDPAKIIFGYSGDNFGNIWFFWWQKLAKSYDLPAGFSPYYNAPAGVNLNLSLAEFAWIIPGNLLARLTGAIFSFNSIIMASFVLSFINAYLLVFYLFKNGGVAALAGLAYAFSPYHYWQSLSHLSLAQVQWLPLFVLSLFYFDKNKNLRSVLFLSSSFLLTAYTSFYYGYFSALVAVAFFFYQFIFHPKNYLKMRIIGLLTLTALIILILVFPIWLALKGSSREAVDAGVQKALSRQKEELLGLSSRPWDFFIYPPNHPVFGRFNKVIYDWIQAQGSDYKVRSTYFPERVVFLGLVNAALAAVGVSFLVKRRFSLGWPIVFLLVASFITSLPPYFPIRGFTLYTPSYFLFNFFPWVRVYARLGVYVLLFTLLLASYGLVILEQYLSSSRFRFFWLFFLIAVVLFELYPWPPAYADLRRLPEVYRWLKEQNGDFVVAEYPKAFDLQTGLLFQTFHGKRLFNMPSSQPRYRIWEEIEDLTQPASFNRLREDGVRYVIYHLTDPTPNPYDDWRFFRAGYYPSLEKSDKISRAGFRLIKEFPEALVYEL